MMPELPQRMKRRYIILILCMALLALPAACSNPPDGAVPNGGDVPKPVLPSPSGDERRHPEFELATDFPTVPEMVTVYRVIPPDITAEWVTELGRKFGFMGEAGSGVPNIISMSDLSIDGKTRRGLRVYTNSGGIRYNCPSKLEPEEYPDYPELPSVSLPSYEEAERIAVDFLSERGLLLPDMRVNYVDVGGTYCDVITHLLVRFRRDINGIPVTGPGHKFGVRIGEKGAIGEVFIVHREIEPYQDVPIKSTAEAYEDLKECKNSVGYYVLPLDCKKVVIEEIYLAYWMDPVRDRQEYVAPVYEFTGECFDEAGNSIGDFTGWVQAMK